MNKLTKEQALIISGYTGVLCVEFSEFHFDAEKRLNRPIWTHEFANEDFNKNLKDLYRPDFLKICHDE